MVARSFRPDRLDVAAFAKAAQTLAGEAPQAAFERLSASLLPGPDGSRTAVHWSALGELRRPRVGPVESWLHLSCSTRGRLTCQRCLEPMEVDLIVDGRAFRFAPDEATAAELDEEIEEDVLVTSTAFDLLNLVEDELLLTLPWVPRHPHCQGVPGSAVRVHAEGQAPTGDDEAEPSEDGAAGTEGPEPARRPSPFAALAALGALSTPAARPAAPATDGPGPAPPPPPVARKRRRS